MICRFGALEFIENARMPPNDQLTDGGPCVTPESLGRVAGVQRLVRQFYLSCWHTPDRRRQTPVRGRCVAALGRKTRILPVTCVLQIPFQDHRSKVRSARHPLGSGQSPSPPPPFVGARREAALPW